MLRSVLKRLRFSNRANVMRKFTFLINLAAILVSSIAVAHTDGIYNPGANSIGSFEGIDSNKASSGGGCSQATTFLARTSGLSGTETTAYTNLICGLVTDGTYSLLDALYIFASNTTTTANLNLISTSFGLTLTGALTFAADVGYTGDGSTGFLDTHLTPSTGGTNFVLNSASIGTYIQSTTANTASVIMGGATTGTFAYMSPVNTGNVFTWDMNDNSFPSFTNTNPQGAWINSRNSSSSTTSLYKNGSATPAGTSGSATSTSLTADTILIFALRNNGTPGNFTNYQASAAFIGGGLSASQAVAVNNRINAYMIALGHNIY
jgi:hypothetical protein